MPRRIKAVLKRKGVKHSICMVFVLYASSRLHIKICAHISDVKGPKKLFPDLPFSNLDTEKVEARRSQLESFLRV